ncbi:hypothetical protein GEMRC1_003259 [Eukaryota sp. GEM-RC1]
MISTIRAPTPAFLAETTTGNDGIAAYRRSNLAEGKRVLITSSICYASRHSQVHVLEDIGFAPAEEHPFPANLPCSPVSTQIIEEIFAQEVDNGLLQFSLISTTSDNKIEGIFQCFISRSMEFWITPLSDVYNIDCLLTIMDIAEELKCETFNIAITRTLAKVKKFTTSLEALGFYQTTSIASFTIYCTELGCESDYFSSDDEDDECVSEYSC